MITTALIAYCIGHTTGAVCDRNRAIIISFALKQYDKAVAYVKGRFKKEDPK